MHKENITALKCNKLAELRAKAGLPPKKTTARIVYDTQVEKNPDHATVTGVKEERGFVYLNLNGGDSWGYYHPATDAKVIYNFKGEPNYLTKELCPEYYTEAVLRAEEVRQEERNQKRLQNTAKDKENFQQQLAQARAKSGRLYIAFRDKTTDQFYIGYYDYGESRHEFHTTSSRDKVDYYLMQHDVEPPEIIETWDYQFRPTEIMPFDPGRRFVNQFVPSDLMQAANNVEEPQVPATILRVITHALGDDLDMVEHFLNWLAVIFQFRIRTQTAWVLQGTTGTGKGLLLNRIIRQLIGGDYCRSITLPNLEDQFNKFMEHTIVLFVDEVDTDQVRDMPKLTARLKNMITEQKLALRGMRVDLREVTNHLNIVMASNQPNSMRIEVNDRRFNVCPRQEKKLLKPGEKGEELISAIQEELHGFADYLRSRTANQELARFALNNEAKRELQKTTQTALEEVAEALRNGDLAYFIEHAPEPNDAITFPPFGGEVINTSDYKRVMEDAVLSIKTGKRHLLKHKDLYVLFHMLVGKIPQSKAKLSSLLRHQNIQVKPQTVEKTSVRGYKVKWRASKTDHTRWAEMLQEKKSGRTSKAA